MNESQIINYLGLIAGTLTTASFVPQVLQIWKRKSADDISTAMFSVFALGSFLWMTYGIGMHSLPVTLANAITLFLDLVVLFLKWKFRFRSSQSLKG